VFEEPLNALSKILVVLVVLFLLLAAVFIGLFAGAQHKLNNGQGGGATVTSTVTATATATATDVKTSTLSPPMPGPTGVPDEVRISEDCHVPCSTGWISAESLPYTGLHHPVCTDIGVTRHGR
jgi:endothelin-converting enzyme